MAIAGAVPRIIARSVSRYVAASLFGGAPTGAAALLGDEDEGLAIDFTSNKRFGPTGFYGDALIKDLGTPANDYNTSPVTAASSLLTYTSPSPKLTLGPDGTYRYQAHNLCTYSEDLTNWSVSGTPVVTATTAEDDDASGYEYVARTVTLVSGAVYVLKFQVAKDAVGATTRAPLLRIAGGGNRDFYIDTSTGDYLQNGTAVDAVSVTSDDTYWYVSLRWTAAQASNSIFLYPAAATSSDSLATATLSPTVVGTVTATKFHVYRYPADTTYLKTTSAIRYDLPYEWNTSGVLQGVLVEPAATNLALYASDFTNAAWTKSNMTTAKTAEGPDGVSNSATTLTATAGNATALQAITSASSARITSVFIKRRTGTGNIDLTQDNGSTWTTQAVDSTWTRFNLSSVTSTNPTVGIRIVTSGDAVDVALFQHETGSAVTSPIITYGSTATRAADAASRAVTGYPHSATVNSGLVQFAPLNAATATAVIQLDDGTSNEVVSIGYDASANIGLTVTDGGAAQTAPLADGTVTANATETIGFSWKANDFLLSDNGATAVADTSGTLPTVTTLKIRASGGPILLKKMLLVPAEKSAAEVEAYGATS